MIDVDEIKNLPADATEAFIQFEEMCRKRMAEILDGSWEAEKLYALHIEAFVEEHGIPIELPPVPSQDDEMRTYMAEVRRRVDKFCIRARVRSYRGGLRPVDVVTFNDEARDEVHGLIGTIRRIIFASDIETKKKDSILAKLNALADEVDRSRTRLDVLTDVWLDLTSAFNSGVENMSPALEKLQKIANVFGRFSDGAKALEAPEERKLLTGPEDQNS